ncbi:MAG: site-specific integrase [Deltaproteobacteria bacterium]|nr:site-specific integrase [Deltaproteobacteria bacterium]
MGVTVRQKERGKNQPWWIFINHDGRRTSRRIGDRQAAEAVASEIRQRIASGDFGIEPVRSVPTFAEYSNQFMERVSPQRHKPSTRQSFEMSLRLHLLPAFGEKRLDQITRKDIKDFIYKKQQEGLSSSTVRNLKAYLSSILSEAVDDELIDFNPAARTGRLIKKNDKPEIRPLNLEEVRRFEEAVQEHYPRYWPFFLTALRTGMRLGELLALKPGDLDFNGGFIEVRRSFTRGQLVSPKNGRVRKIDMSKQLQAVLKQHLLDMKRQTLRRGWKQVPEWLFYNENGGMLDGDNLRARVFKKVLQKAGLRQVRFHDLRHSYASIRVTKGDNLQDISRQLGHASVGFTLKVYSHWLPGQAKNQVDELDTITAPDRTLYAPKSDFDGGRRVENCG